MKYCGTCGTELVKKFLDAFNVYTGERDFVGQCPNPKCHRSCDHPLSWRGIFSKGCEKCGHVFEGA
jgi:hypothetical protein